MGRGKGGGRGDEGKGSKGREMSRIEQQDFASLNVAFIRNKCLDM